MAKQKVENVVTVKALSTILHNNEAYEAGEAIDLLESDAKRLIESGSAILSPDPVTADK